MDGARDVIGLMSGDVPATFSGPVFCCLTEPGCVPERIEAHASAQAAQVGRIGRMLGVVLHAVGHEKTFPDPWTSGDRKQGTPAVLSPVPDLQLGCSPSLPVYHRISVAFGLS